MEEDNMKKLQEKLEQEHERIKKREELDRLKLDQKSKKTEDEKRRDLERRNRMKEEDAMNLQRKLSNFDEKMRKALENRRKVQQEMYERREERKRKMEELKRKQSENLSNRERRGTWPLRNSPSKRSLSRTSSSVFYKPIKNDKLDGLLGEFLADISSDTSVTIPQPIVRISSGNYFFGQSKAQIKSVNGNLVVRVGGGWERFEDYIRRGPLYRTRSSGHLSLRQTPRISMSPTKDEDSQSISSNP